MCLLNILLSLFRVVLGTESSARVPESSPFVTLVRTPLASCYFATSALHVFIFLAISAALWPILE